MKEIIAELRRCADGYPGGAIMVNADLLAQAADEIERLRSDVKLLRHMIEMGFKEIK